MAEFEGEVLAALSLPLRPVDRHGYQGDVSLIVYRRAGKIYWRLLHHGSRALGDGIASTLPALENEHELTQAPDAEDLKVFLLYSNRAATGEQIRLLWSSGGKAGILETKYPPEEWVELEWRELPR